MFDLQAISKEISDSIATKIQLSEDIKLLNKAIIMVIIFDYRLSI